MKTITAIELNQLIRHVLSDTPGSATDARRAIHIALNDRFGVPNGDSR